MKKLLGSFAILVSMASGHCPMHVQTTVTTPPPAHVVR